MKSFDIFLSWNKVINGHLSESKLCFIKKKSDYTSKKKLTKNAYKSYLNILKYLYFLLWIVKISLDRNVTWKNLFHCFPHTFFTTLLPPQINLLFLCDFVEEKTTFYNIISSIFWWNISTILIIKEKKCTLKGMAYSYHGKWERFNSNQPFSQQEMWLHFHVHKHNTSQTYKQLTSFICCYNHITGFIIFVYKSLGLYRSQFFHPFLFLFLSSNPSGLKLLLQLTNKINQDKDKCNYPSFW